MGKNFYWYDLETSGTEPRWDRIVQFAGCRTSWDLTEISDSFVTDVRLPDDVLPDPSAALVTGITPQRTAEAGISEWQLLRQVSEAFAHDKTCVVGYNNLRFDDEFMRFSFYRNLRDPYQREWKNGNSRWDLVDLVRAAGALRPEGLEWPMDEEGFPVYRLEALTAANGLDHASAHDAMSDVHATIGMARRIKAAQPKLFDYYLKCRDKKFVRSLLEPYGNRVCVHVSGMYPKERFRVAPVLPIARHPTNGNSVIVADVGTDIDMLLHDDEQTLRQNLFTRGSTDRPPLKELRLNRCPFVAEFEVLTEANMARAQIDPAAVKQRVRKLRQPAVLQKIARLYQPQPMPPADDVDAALYDGFLPEEDRSRCAVFNDALAELEWRDMDFRDKRLPVLADRLRARSFPELMNDAQRAEWRQFVGSKLTADNVPWRTLTQFRDELAAVEQADHPVIEALRAHLTSIEAQYAL